MAGLSDSPAGGPDGRSRRRRRASRPGDDNDVTERFRFVDEDRVNGRRVCRRRADRQGSGRGHPGPAAARGRRLGRDSRGAPDQDRSAPPASTTLWQRGAVGHSSGARIPAVVFEDGDRRFGSAAVLPAVAARKAFAYDAKPQGPTGPGPPAGVRLRPSGSDLDVTIDDRPLTTYRPMSGSKPIFYPVIGPTGDPFTRSYPMENVPGEDRDHPHQRSFWFTHGSVNEDRLPGSGGPSRHRGK